MDAVITSGVIRLGNHWGCDSGTIKEDNESKDNEDEIKESVPTQN